MKHDAMAEVPHAVVNAQGWLTSILEMVEALERSEEQAVHGPDETDAVRSRIEESVLSVLVRDGWRLPGVIITPGAEEYEILLTTGGPALRITGKLNEHNEPDDFPRLEYQDWYQPWTEYTDAREHREALQRFASCFYYGD
jgi:hypothetical protein